MSCTEAGPYPFAKDLQPPAPQVATPLPGFHVPIDVVFALGQGDVAQGVAMLQHFMLPPMPGARDWFPLEPDPDSAEAIKFATEACGALYSALNALRARGFLKISDQMLGYYATPWRSPWPVLAEAERLRQVACNHRQGPCA